MDKCPCPDCNKEDTFARLTRERDEAVQALESMRIALRPRDTVDALKEIDRLRALLREVEEYHDECQFCGAWKTGHAPDCRLKAALEGRDA